MIVQNLQVANQNRRLEFYHWYMQKCEEDHEFYSEGLYTDQRRISNCDNYNLL